MRRLLQPVGKRVTPSVWSAGEGAGRCIGSARTHPMNLAGPGSLGLALPNLACVEEASSDGSTRHGFPMASSRFPPVLVLEGEASASSGRAAGRGPRHQQPHPRNDRRQSTLGRSSNSRRVAQARHHSSAADRRQMALSRDAGGVEAMVDVSGVEAYSVPEELLVRLAEVRSRIAVDNRADIHHAGRTGFIKVRECPSCAQGIRSVQANSTRLPRARLRTPAVTRINAFAVVSAVRSPELLHRSGLSVATPSCICQ